MCGSVLKSRCCSGRGPSLVPSTESGTVYDASSGLLMEILQTHVVHTYMQAKYPCKIKMKLNFMDWEFIENLDWIWT